MSASRANTSPIGRSIVVRVSYRTVVVPALRVRRPRNASDSTVIAVSPIRCPCTPTSRTRKRWDLCPDIREHSPLWHGHAEVRAERHARRSTLRGMTKFVVDASAVLHLASTDAEVSDNHELLAPTLLRSQTLSALHEAVQRGEISAEVARG